MCEAFAKIEIFFHDVQLKNSGQKNSYCASLKGISEATIRNIEEASGTLLPHHVLSDIVQSVWTSAVTQRLVIQFSKLGHFCVEVLRAPIKAKIANYLVIFGIYSLLALQ